ncbi:MAG: DUF2017 domain-containing protein [Sporichthyaceae bacterium]
MRVKRGRGGFVALELEPHEAAILRNAFGELLVLLGTRESDADTEVAEIAPGVRDPFADTVDRSLPADPALARLLPDAYPDDPEATSEFRRFTEADLVADKRANVEMLLSTLVPGLVNLDPAQAHAWLFALNDLRLMLGTRLEIDEEYSQRVADMSPEHPLLPAFALYEWLTALQDALVRAQR